MGELRHKIEQLLKGAGRDGHGRMLMGEHDAVLVVIYIGAVLQIPSLSAERQRHHTVILARGKIHAARIADVLDAQHTFGIAGCRLQALQSDGLGILFRFCEVDGDLQPAVFAGIVPFDVFGDLRGADIVGCDAQAVEIVRGRAHALRLPQLLEPGGRLAFPGHHRAHDARLKIYAQSGHLPVVQAAGRRVIQQSVQQYGGNVQMLLRHAVRPRLRQAEQVQQRVARHIGVQLADERMLQAELKQPFD